MHTLTQQHHVCHTRAFFTFLLRSRPQFHHNVVIIRLPLWIKCSRIFQSSWKINRLNSTIHIPTECMNGEEQWLINSYLHQKSLLQPRQGHKIFNTSLSLTFPTANKILLKQTSVHSTMAWLILKKVQHSVQLYTAAPNERQPNDWNEAAFGSGGVRARSVWFDEITWNCDKLILCL